MFIAHLPAGYLLTTSLQRRFKTGKLLWLGLLASVLPDLDLLYFFLIDGRRTLHHDYWIHRPFFWLILLGAAWLASFLVKKDWFKPALIIFFANIFLHLVLDTFVAGISWLYPLTTQSFNLVEVPARYGFWVWNFVFHWSFAVEMFLVGWAAARLYRRRRVI